MEPGEPEMTEAGAYPAMPDNEYGWEKLYAERVAQAYGRRFGIAVRSARLQNTYGPAGTWAGGREKAPATCAAWGRAKGRRDDRGMGRWFGDPLIYLRE